MSCKATITVPPVGEKVVSGEKGRRIDDGVHPTNSLLMDVRLPSKKAKRAYVHNGLTHTFPITLLQESGSITVNVMRIITARLSDRKLCPSMLSNSFGRVCPTMIP